MQRDQLTLLILSCDNFSDLWEGNIKLLEQNWPDRNIKTYIVTDKQTDRKFENVDIIAVPDAMEWSDRLASAVRQVETDYVMVSLDDYFLIKPVADNVMQSRLDMMKQCNLTYLRLFPRPKRATREKLEGYPKIYRIDTDEKYSVNLYTGIWKKDFLEYTVQESKNAWRFEVSLPRRAREYGAKCAASYNPDFVILDVVRKGKLLHKAARYFKKHDIYHGNREVQSYRYEMKLGIRTWGARHMPKPIVDAARNFMIRRGHHYFSEES